MHQMNCFIIGAGSVGTVLAAHLVKAGHQVTCYARPERRADYEAVEKLEMASLGNSASISVPRPDIVDQYALEDVDVLFLCIKHGALDDVLSQLPEKLPEGLILVPCLNGVGLSPRLRERFPGTEVAQLTIMFNARIDKPLSAILTTKAEVQFNTENPKLLKLFDGSGIHMGQVDDAAEYGKLLINLNNAIGGATQTTFKDMLVNKTLTRLFVSIMDEAIAVYDASNTDYTLPIPVPYGLYRWVLLNGGPIAWWIAKKKNGLTDQAFPSMAADIQAGRATEIEQLNGMIVKLGEQAGVDTPVNRKLVQLIHEIERGERQILTPDALSSVLN